MGNKLYYGDNLEIMRKYIADESIDLIYLDPPFNSQRAYNVIFPDKTGKWSTAQIQAFEDTWYWSLETQTAFDQIMLGKYASELKEMMKAFKQFMGTTNLMAYLTMMAIRLVEMHRALKPTGSIYLHCDPTASHYLRILLDQIFGPDNILNEIIWQRTNTKSLQSRRFPNCHDVILAYAKSPSSKFNKIFIPYDQSYLEDFYKYTEKKTGRIYRLSDVTNPNKNRPNLTYTWKGVRRVWRWTKEKMEEMEQTGRLVYSSKGVPSYKRYLDEMPGVPISDVWTDVQPIQAHAKEALGYPTQKPQALLERIIQASSNEGDVVMDPFCGCGTAVVGAEKLGRSWIGIDVTHLAISLVKKRIFDHFPDAKFEVIGEPTSVDAAEELFKQSAFQFESWAVSLVGGQPYKSTGGGDTGMDGFLYFQDFKHEYHRIIIEVKGGDYQPKDVRALAHVLEREQSPMGILITLRKPTRGMLTAAASLGNWSMPGSRKSYPVMQIMTIEDFFAGKKPELPDTSATLKKAKREIRSRELDNNHKLDLGE